MVWRGRMKGGDGESLVSPYGPSDLRLGWLQSFAATVRHTNYEKAATELGLSLKQLKANNSKLELWLHKLLIDDDGPPDIYEGAIEIYVTVQGVLDRLGDQFEESRALGRLRFRQPDFSSLWLSEFAAVQIISEFHTYKAVADDLDCSLSQARRKIEKLEARFAPIVTGRAVLTLTPFGCDFAEMCRSIISELTRHRAVIPADYDPTIERLRQVRSDLMAMKFKSKVLAGVARKQGKLKKIDRVHMTLAERSLGHIDTLLDVLPRLPLVIDAGVDPATIEVSPLPPDDRRHDR